jgi:hypothetical protein
VGLLDANVFITAKNVHYSFDVFPGFWDWLDERAAAGELASTDMVFDELTNQDDDLADWVRGRKQSIFHVTSTSLDIANSVTEIGRWMNSVAFKAHVQAEFMDGADPFLAAVAMVRGDTVVTLETFDAAARRKVKLPNACQHLGVPYETTYEMLRSLNARF